MNWNSRGLHSLFVEGFTTSVVDCFTFGCKIKLSNFGRSKLKFGRQWTKILDACILCLLKILQLRSWTVSLFVDRTWTSIVFVLQNQWVNLLFSFSIWTSVESLLNFGRALWTSVDRILKSSCKLTNFSVSNFAKFWLEEVLLCQSPNSVD